MALEVTNMRLMCEFAPPSGGNDAADVSGPLAFEAPDESISLRASERVRLRLKARPMRAGVLKITGVQWTLNGTAHGKRQLDVPGPQTRRVQGQWLRDLPPSKRLQFNVAPAMPLLRCEAKIPETVAVGSLTRVPMVLTNVGAVALRGLRLVTSSTTAVVPGASPAELEGSLTQGLVVAGGESAATGDKGVFVFPEQHAVLEPGASLTWPLWVHPQEEGELDVRLVLYYQPVQETSDMRYRVLRVACSLRALSSLRAEAKLEPSRLDTRRCVLRVQIESLRASHSIVPRQIVVAGTSWSVAPLGSGAGADPGALALEPGCASNTLFRVSPTHEEGVGGSVALGGGACLVEALGGSFLALHRAALGPAPADTETLDVALLWEAEDSSGEPTVGATHMRVALADARMAPKCPLRWVLDAPSRVSHCFAGAGLCEVPVTLHVTNGGDVPADVVVEAVDAGGNNGAAPDGWRRDDGSAGAQGTVTTSPPWMWAGGIRVVVPGVAPGASSSINFRAILFAPGTFDLGLLRLRWVAAGAEGAAEALKPLLVTAVDEAPASA